MRNQTGENCTLTALGVRGDSCAVLEPRVLSGGYPGVEIDWFHGERYLSKDSVGVVYWRGVEVEHYNFADLGAEARAASVLALRCRMLEEKGFPVNSRSVLDQKFIDAPRDTPWLSLLLYLDKCVLDERQRARWLMLTRPDGETIVLSRFGGELNGRLCCRVISCRDLRWKRSSDRLFACTYGYTYDFLIEAVEAGGFNPADIEQALA